MSRRETYETRTEELLRPIVERFGVEIYDVEYVKEGSDWYLRAYIDKPEGVNIEVGKEGTISIETGRAENVITVPVSSLYTADGKDYVYVLTDDNMREVRWVEVGLQGNDTIEIKSGLNEGERVVRR